METKEMNLEGYAHSEGVEVKVSAARVNITILLYLFLYVVGAVVMFNYIWGDGSSYGAGYELGNIARLQALSVKGAIIMAAYYFDLLVNTISKTTNYLGKTTKELGARAEQTIEAQKIRNKITGEERIIEKIKVDIGDVIYRRHSQGD